MFLDYANAVKARAAGKNAGRQMYLAYMIGARVQQILREAQPALAAAGLRRLQHALIVSWTCSRGSRATSAGTI